MHLLLFSGFLGAGKTTLVIPLTQAVIGLQCRVAIVVNEIGEIGIDNQLMRQLDLNVWELVNGCICCTLVSDLTTTLQQLDAGYAPDLVIVEASGAANPQNVLGALPFYRGRPLASVRTVSVVDPLRLQMLIEVLTPLISAQIQQADLVIISKRDLASAEELASAVQTVQALNPAAALAFAGRGEDLAPDLVGQLAPWLTDPMAAVLRQRAS